MRDDIGLGVVVTTESHGIPNTNIADESAADERVGIVEVVETAVAFGTIKAAGKVIIDEIEKPNEMLKGDVLTMASRCASVEFLRNQLQTSHTT